MGSIPTEGIYLCYFILHFLLHFNIPLLVSTTTYHTTNTHLHFIHIYITFICIQIYIALYIFHIYLIYLYILTIYEYLFVFMDTIIYALLHKQRSWGFDININMYLFSILIWLICTGIYDIYHFTCIRWYMVLVYQL